MHFSCITQLVVLCYGSSKKLIHHPTALKDMWPQQWQVRGHISILPLHVFPRKRLLVLSSLLTSGNSRAQPLFL